MTATGSEVSAARSTSLPSIDGLRAIAVLLVVIGHAARTAGFPVADVIRAMGDLGNLGVRLFFVVSGFLITYLLLTEEARAGRISLSRFYLRRSLRIFPAFYVFLLAMGVAAIIGIVVIPGRDFVAAATYTMNFSEVRSWYLGHTWSLSVEEQFYLLWPGVFVLAAARRLLIVIAVIALAPLARIATFLIFPDMAPMIGEPFHTVADAIATGAALAMLRPVLHASATYMRMLRSPLVIMIAVAVFGLNALGPDFTVFRWLVGWTLLNVGIMIVLDRVITVPDDGLGRLLNTAPASLLGKMSYSIYLWQQPFMSAHGSSVASVFPINVFLTGCCAWMSYRFVERPTLRLKDRIGGSYGRRSA